MVRANRRLYQDSTDVADLDRQVAERALPLRGPDDLDPLLERIGDARYVLLGEASHGHWWKHWLNAAPSFDAVLSNFGIHHFPEPVKALREAYRVLGPGGRLAFTTWAAPSENIAWQLLFDAISAYGGPGPISAGDQSGASRSGCAYAPGSRGRSGSGRRCA